MLVAYKENIDIIDMWKCRRCETLMFPVMSQCDGRKLCVSYIIIKSYFFKVDTEIGSWTSYDKHRHNKKYLCLHFNKLNKCRLN